MKPLRIIYTLVMVLCLGLTFAFYYRYILKVKELAEYQRLSKETDEAYLKASKELSQNEKELAESIQEVKKLNKAIAQLEQNNRSSKTQLQGLEQERGQLKQLLRQEREQLQQKIVQLSEEKSSLEQKLLALEQKFSSVAALKQAIKAAKIEQRHAERIQNSKQRMAQIEQQKALDKIALEEGNRGYLTKDGRLTHRLPKIGVQLESVEGLSGNKD